MLSDETPTKDIAPKYLALVERYKTEPFKSFKRVKMMMDFIWWFRNHRDSLTDDEKEYLQNNITQVNDDNLWSYNY